MTPDTQLALTGLQFHRHGIYEIGLSADGTRWYATRIDAPGVTLSAGSGTELRTLIENDHAERKPATPRRLADGASL